MKLDTDLRRAVRGRVVVPGDEGFDQARRAWNVAVDQPAVAVVEAEDANDVAALVRYAHKAGLAVSAQPSGHGAAAGGMDGVILLRTKRLGGVRVVPEQRLARVGAGVLWREVLFAGGPHGLIGLAGSSPAPSVVGFTLGGGLSWFGRRFGFAANGVRAFDVVDGEGVRARVDADSDPDLFWALRGGGGDFALVTAVEFDLYPAPSLYGGRILWPAARAGAVLDVFRQVTADAPEDISIWFDLFRFPNLPTMPPFLRGLSVVAVYTTFLGSTGDAGALLSRFSKIDGITVDSRGPLTAAELGGIIGEPTRPGPGIFRAELLTGLDDPAAAALLSEPIEPLLSVQVRHLGGALSRPVDGGGACGHLREPFLLRMSGIPSTPELATAVLERQNAIAKALSSNISGRKPFTYLGTREKASAAFAKDTLARLREIKRARDPRGVFRGNYPVLH